MDPKMDPESTEYKKEFRRKMKEALGEDSRGALNAVEGANKVHWHGPTMHSHPGKEGHRHDRTTYSDIFWDKPAEYDTEEPPRADEHKPALLMESWDGSFEVTEGGGRKKTVDREYVRATVYVRFSDRGFRDDLRDSIWRWIEHEFKGSGAIYSFEGADDEFISFLFEAKIGKDSPAILKELENNIKKGIEGVIETQWNARSKKREIKTEASSGQLNITDIDIRLKASFPEQNRIYIKPVDSIDTSWTGVKASRVYEPTGYCYGVVPQSGVALAARVAGEPISRFSLWIGGSEGQRKPSWSHIQVESGKYLDGLPEELLPTDLLLNLRGQLNPITVASLMAQVKSQGQPNLPGAQVEASAFDQIEELELGSGYKARKKKGKKVEGEPSGPGEIEVLDSSGKLMDTYPDAFGDDSVMIIKFLRQVLDITDEEPGKEGKEEKREKKEKKAEKKGEKEGEKASEKPKVLPNVEKKDEKMEASMKYGQEHIELAREISARLLTLGQISANPIEIEAALLDGNSLIESQKKAAKKAVEAKVFELLGESHASLLNLKSSLHLIASKKTEVPVLGGAMGPVFLNAARTYLPELDQQGQGFDIGMALAKGR
jgi:hypothetical protein